MEHNEKMEQKIEQAEKTEQVEKTQEVEKTDQAEKIDQCDHSKMSRDYLKEMEEKIFHVKHSGDASAGDPDPERTEAKQESLPLSTKSSSCYTQFPRDLLHQLSQSERFESQHMKCEAKSKVACLRKDEEEARSKRSSSVPAISRRLTKMKNPRTFELFNPNYNERKADLGKSLLESIRSKVFGFSLEREDTDDEWKCHSNQSSDTTLRLPKETRHAMTYSDNKTPRFCVSCSRLIKNVKTIDAQTSPIVSTTQMIVTLAPPMIPCTLNLLCDKGIHLGKCEEAIREKLHEPVCGEDCICRCEDLERTPNFVDQEPSTSSSTMNGLNGHTNGDLNGCGDIITQNQQKGCWTIGLINSKFRYLTAETFGFKINANGASLKKKQIWTLEPEGSNGDSLIYLRSHLDKYLAVDSFGNVTCESEEKDPGCVFQISVSEDGTGRWALKNVVRGYFLGSTSDKLTCTAKVPGDAEFWHIHLAARPQVNLRSVGRKRFAHLSENLDEIHVDANIPWGEDTLFTLEFRLEESGKYAIHTCNNKYLSMGGKLVEACNKDCLFSAEYHSGQLALRDRTGAYLSPIGSKAVLKTRSNTVTKDELFSLEDSLPQASFVASLNSRFVSVKQGVDVTANQDEISDHETFQLEFDWSTKRWYIRTMQDRYWTLETGGGIQASGDKRSSNALFDLVWQGDGSLAFRANNGRYVITKRSGHLYATADTIDDNCKYFFYLINRPILVLKCEQGFVGYKSASSPKLECNKATYECIQVERGEKGIVYFKGQNGKYWHVDTEGVTADSDSQEGFYLELREPTRLCIKSQNGNYLTASKNGLFRLGDTNIENATQWEY